MQGLFAQRGMVRACPRAPGEHASRRRHTTTRPKPRKCAYLPREHQEHLSLSFALEGTSSSAATSAETITAFVRAWRGECDGMCCGDPVKQCWSGKKWGQCIWIEKKNILLLPLILPLHFSFPFCFLWQVCCTLHSVGGGARFNFTDRCVS